MTGYNMKTWEGWMGTLAMGLNRETKLGFMGIQTFQETNLAQD